MMNRGTILRGIGGFYTVLDDEGRSYTLRALRDGEIAPERYERYRELLNEMKERWKNRYD